MSARPAPRVCPDCDHPRVTLIDGSQTCSWSQAWRHECEARAVLAMPDRLQRRQYLRGDVLGDRVIKRGIRQVRGEEACLRLETTIKAIWALRT